MTATSQPVPAAPSRRRLRLLLGTLAVVSVLLLALAFYLISRPDLPAVPTVKFEGVDPEIVESIAAARMEVEHSPRDAGAWGRLAMALHAHSFHAEALTAYSAAAALDPANPAWHYLPGVIHLEGAEPATALPFLKRAADLAPPNSPPRVRLAEALLELGKTEEAQDEFRKVLAANPKDARASFGAAQLAARTHRPDIALQYLDDALASPFARQRACALKVSLYSLLGDSAAANREQERLAHLPRDTAWPDPFLAQMLERQAGLDARLSRAASLERQGRDADALGLLEETVRRYPNSDEAWSNLGNASGRGNDHAGAEQALRKCTELAPGRGDHWHFLGVAQRHRHRFKEATVSLQNALKRIPDNPATHLELAKCLQELGDHKGAASAFRAALHLDPKMDEARRALNSINSNP